jgi:hypothetical protein
MWRDMSACWSWTKRDSSSSHWILTCSLHDTAEKIAELALNNNHSLTIHQVTSEWQRFQDVVYQWKLKYHSTAGWDRFTLRAWVILIIEDPTVTCRTPIKVLFVYFTLCQSVMFIFIYIFLLFVQHFHLYLFLLFVPHFHL